MITIGETLEPYRVEASIGGDGLTASYRGRHLTLGTPHALELLKGTTPDDRDRLLADARSQAALQHPNILAVTDVILARGSAVLVSDLVKGPTLETWLSKGRVPVDVALALFRGIVTGLGVAHAAGLVHSDLKPSNVRIVRGESGALVPKIAHIGLARLLGERWLTEGGQVVGGTAYLAPEQLGDPGINDVRTDLWSLGCILYELVTGARAFPASGWRELREIIAAVTYEDPVTLAPHVPTRVLDVIRDLLREDRGARIASCRHLWVRLWDTAPPPELSAVQAEPSEAEIAAASEITAPVVAPPPVDPALVEVEPGVPLAATVEVEPTAELAAIVEPEPVVQLAATVEPTVEVTQILEAEPTVEIAATARAAPAESTVASEPTVDVEAALSVAVDFAPDVADPEVADEVPVPLLAAARRPIWRVWYGGTALAVALPVFLVFSLLTLGVLAIVHSSSGEPGLVAVADALPEPEPEPKAEEPVVVAQPRVHATSRELPVVPPARPSPPPKAQPASPPPPPKVVTPSAARPDRRPDPVTPAPVAPALGTVSIDGDAVDVWLDAGGRRLAADQPVPAGRYLLRASWGDGVARSAGEIQVRSGKRTRVRCASFVYACTEIASDTP